MTVSQADVAFMRGIQNAMNGTASLNAAPIPSSYKPAGTAGPGFTPDHPSMYIDNMKNFMRIMEGVEPTNTQPSITKSYAGQDYEVIVDLNESGRIYMIKDSQKNIYKDKTFSVFEAAMGVCKILNGEGKAEYVKEFMDLDEDFQKEKEKAIGAKTDYSRSIKVNESRAASIFENKFKRHQESANSIYEDIKSLFAII